MVTAAGGAWEFDLDDIGFDLTFDTGVEARVTDGDGDATTVGNPQPPVVDASHVEEFVRGQGFDPSSTVDITVLDAPGSLNPPVAEVLGFVTDGDGNFHWETGADLMPGYEVTVVGSTKVLELVLLTFDVFDVATNVISGTATTGTDVQIGGGNESEGLRCDGDRHGWCCLWSFDLDDIGFDLTFDTGVEARVTDGDGDSTVASPPPPAQIEASPVDEFVRGGGFDPDSTVDITVRDAPATSGGSVVVFDPVFPTDSEGNFHWDTGVDLMPGYEVTVVGSTKVLVLVPLTFDVFNVATEVISGTADPGTDVQVNGGNESEGFEVIVTADAGGDWSTDLTGTIDLTADMGSEARVVDDDGDATVAGPFGGGSVVEQLDGLQFQLEELFAGGELKQGNFNMLQKELNKALAELEDENLKKACKALKKFIKKVDKTKDAELPPDQKLEHTDQATAIMDAIGC